MIGELSLHYEGYGFVVPLAPKEPDVFIPARLIGDALHGDVVEVKTRKGRKGLLEGEVVRVVTRGLKQLVGRLELAGKKWCVVSEDARVRHRLYLTAAPRIAHAGDYVVARIVGYPAGEKPMTGEVIEKLPERGTLPAEIEYVIAKHQWPKNFPAEVNEEAAVIGRRGLAGSSDSRHDLRSLPFVTIDGEDAKDFDDAVCAKNLPNGHIQLWVAIADVSHYVQPRSALDKEAYARSTSVYFPGRVLPMLPEILSNDLCSLRPNEDRLAMVAELELDKNGEVAKENFYSAIFQSHARLTYTFVKRLLVDQEPSLRDEARELLPMLETLSEAAHRLKAMRDRRGSLDFDLPEPEIILDLTGGIENIEKSSRHWAHQIIEELMIAANESVARFLTRKKIGCLYRVHDGPDPEKIQRFYKMVQVLGYKGKLSQPVTPKGLSNILKHFKNHPEERFINSVMLRSLAQAVYSPQNLGHFGLGSDCYCHFTSPIRRYPDLVVHRLLKGHSPGGGLQEMATQTSRQERKAMEAEREMVALHKSLFLQQKLGESYEGIISHVTRFGFFVELFDYFVEGLVTKESLPGDFYLFDEEKMALKGKKRGKVFKIGAKVRIIIDEVKLSERRAFFKLLDTPQKG